MYQNWENECPQYQPPPQLDLIALCESATELLWSSSQNLLISVMAICGMKTVEDKVILDDVFKISGLFMSHWIWFRPQIWLYMNGGSLILKAYNLFYWLGNYSNFEICCILNDVLNLWGFTVIYTGQCKNTKHLFPWQVLNSQSQPKTTHMLTVCSSI
jgi:hypothetical protein